jgi:hypothetical protein
MSTELRDTAERVTRLERQARRVTRYEGRRSDIIVPVENVSGADLEHGATVVLQAIGSDGVLEVAKPDADSDMQYLGHIVGRLGAGAKGRCQIAGIAEARRDTTAMNGTNPVIGAHIGPLEASHLLGHDQFGANFLADLYDCGNNVKLCLVLLTHSDRLLVDHRGSHVESTPVYEIKEDDSYVNGLISDQWCVEVHTVGRYSSTWFTMLDFRRDSNHNHGWSKGIVITESSTGGEVGWGPWSDIIGIRAPNQSNVDLKTLAQFNDGKYTAPILFDPEQEFSTKAGQYVVGSMVFDAGVEFWRPAVPVLYELESRVVYPPGYFGPCDEGPGADKCRLLVDPSQYQKSGTVTGPWDTTTSACNYLDWIACNRWDINGIFRLLWYVSCCFSMKIGPMDSKLQSLLSSNQTIDSYLQALEGYLSANDAALQCLDTAVGGVCSTAVANVISAHGGVQTAYAAISWYATGGYCNDSLCGTDGVFLEELRECPYDI